MTKKKLLTFEKNKRKGIKEYVYLEDRCIGKIERNIVGDYIFKPSFLHGFWSHAGKSLKEIAERLIDIKVTENQNEK